MGDQVEPLLAHAREDELWDAVEGGRRAPRDTFTVGHLLREHPTQVLKTLQDKSVRRVAEFMVEDTLALDQLGDDSIVTMGSDFPELEDPEGTWIALLKSKAPRQRRRHRHKDGHGWNCKIPVLAYTVLVEDAAKPDADGLLQPLLKRWQAGACGMDVFALPAVQAVIDWKWTQYCHTALLLELSFYMVWLLSFAVFTILFQDEDTTLSFGQLIKTARGRATVAMDILSLIGMAPFLVIEGATFAHYGPWGWASLWNVLDLVTYVLQISIVALHLGRTRLAAGWLSVAAAVQCILLLFRLQYFSRVFKSTRFAFLDDIKEVMHDVKYYLVFLLLVVAGWGLALHILFRADQEEHKEFSTYPMTLLTMVGWMDGNVELASLPNSRNPLAASLLGVGFVFVMGVILMNLLIGVLTASLQRVTENEGLRMLLSKAEVIDEVDSTLPSIVEKRFPRLYPKYLHVLRVDPGRLDKVEIATIWGQNEINESPQGDDQAGEEQARHDDGNDDAGADKSKSDELEKKVDELRREVSELKDILLSMRSLPSRASTPRVDKMRSPPRSMVDAKLGHRITDADLGDSSDTQGPKSATA